MTKGGENEEKPRDGDHRLFSLGVTIIIFQVTVRTTTTFLIVSIFYRNFYNNNIDTISVFFVSVLC